jgi:hypothetical protein
VGGGDNADAAYPYNEHGLEKGFHGNGLLVCAMSGQWMIEDW